MTVSREQAVEAANKRWCMCQDHSACVSDTCIMSRYILSLPPTPPASERLRFDAMSFVRKCWDAHLHFLASSAQEDGIETDEAWKAARERNMGPLANELSALVAPVQVEVVEAAERVISHCSHIEERYAEHWLLDAVSVARHILDRAGETDDGERADSEWIKALPKMACDQILWHRKVFATLNWTKGRCRQLLAALGIDRAN